jgi:hypothetical protein
MNYAVYFSIEKRMHQSGVVIPRDELIYDFTDGKKQSLKSLTHWEYNEFINWLNRTFPSTPDIKLIRSNAMRRKIIGIFSKMGWRQAGKADMERIYGWVLQYSYLKKSLNDYSYSELPQLVTQVEIVYKKYIENVEK